MKNKIASMFEEKKWTKRLMKKVVGKFISVGFTDTKYIAQGVAYYPDGNEDYIKIFTTNGNRLDITPSQIVAMEDMVWPSDSQ